MLLLLGCLGLSALHWSPSYDFIAVISIIASSNLAITKYCVQLENVLVLRVLGFLVRAGTSPSISSSDTGLRQPGLLDPKCFLFFIEN